MQIAAPHSEAPPIVLAESVNCDRHGPPENPGVEVEEAGEAGAQNQDGVDRAERMGGEVEALVPQGDRP